MRSTPSAPLPLLDATRPRRIQHVPACASLASFASSTGDNCGNAMQTDAVGLGPDDAIAQAMTQPVTQAQPPGGRGDTEARRMFGNHVAHGCARRIPHAPRNQWAHNRTLANTGQRGVPAWVPRRS